MTQPFTPKQSEEIDDRIVAMIVAVLGEGDAARRCRVIANERYLDNVPEIDDRNLGALSPEDKVHRPLPSEGSVPRATDDMTANEVLHLAASARGCGSLDAAPDAKCDQGDFRTAHVRLECLKLAFQIGGRDPRLAINLAIELEKQVINGFRTLPTRSIGVAD